MSGRVINADPLKKKKKNELRQVELKSQGYQATLTIRYGQTTNPPTSIIGAHSQIGRSPPLKKKSWLGLKLIKIS
jgi:hypothetical protein